MITSREGVSIHLAVSLLMGADVARMIPSVTCMPAPTMLSVVADQVSGSHGWRA